MIEGIVTVAIVGVLSGIAFKNRKTLEAKIKADIDVVKAEITKLEEKAKAEVKKDETVSTESTTSTDTSAPTA